jgi:hypothetical protein
MEMNNDEDIKKIIKKIYPEVTALDRFKVCPSEDELAAFADSKLKGKKEGNLISHLAVCNDCLETIKFLRQAPSEEVVSVPLWLKRRVYNLFAVEPKTWEIVVKYVKDVFEIIKHTAESCWTIPELAVVPVKEKRLPSPRTDISAIDLIPRNILISPEDLVEYFDRLSMPSKKVKRAYLPVKTRGKSWFPGDFLKRVSKRISRGLVFMEHMGAFDVFLIVRKRKDSRPDIFEIQIEVYDSSGKLAKDVEILFVQGRKTIDKLLTHKVGRISRSVAPQRFRIKFKHKGIYLGQAVLDLREKKRK